MGMYDTVEVHRKLPLQGIPANEIRALKQGVNWKEVEFQTKSIDNCMDHYKIAINGKLYIQRANYTEVKESRKVSHADFPMMKIDGKPWFEPAPKTPTSLIFYGNVKTSPHRCVDYWLECEAIFLRGKLHEIKLISLESIDAEAAECIPKMKQDSPFRGFLKKLIKWQEKLLLGKKC